MAKVKLKRFRDMKSKENVFDWEDYNQNKPFPKGTWNTEIFKNENPIVLELACGKGEYSVGLAKLNPDKNYIGIDIKGSRMWVGATQAEEENLTNTRFLRAYIDHADQFFGENEISEIWIIFPDPYINKERKRLTSPKFLELYKRFLKPNAVINLKTDSDLLYEYTKEVIVNQNLELIKDLNDVHKQVPEHKELSIITHYENLHLQNNKTIKFLSFKLK